MAGRVLVILLAFGVAVVSFAASRGDEKPAGRPAPAKPSASPAPSGALRIQFAYSPEKQNLIPPLVKAFATGQ